MTYSHVFDKICTFFLKVKNSLSKEAFYSWYVFAVIFSFFVLISLLIEKPFSLDDHFFHIRFAQEFREQGLNAFTHFQSIYFSRMGIGSEYLVYYNFLFYIALIPFTFLNPLVLGIKLYGALVLTSVFFVPYMFLKKISVKQPFLWTVFFFVVLAQSGLIGRFSLMRPFTLAPIFLVISLYFLYKKRYWPLGIIAFLYFYWHTATFLFPFCLAFGYFIFEQFYGKRPDWKLVIAPLIGTASAVFLAYLVSPGVIAYLRDVIFPVFFDTTFTKTTGIVEGNEVYGRSILVTIQSFFWFLALFCVAGSYEILRYIQSKRDVHTKEVMTNDTIQPLRATLFMASLVFLAGVSLSVRFLDYFVYFCFLYLAIVFDDLIRFFEIKGVLVRKAVFSGVTIAAIFLLVNISLGIYDTFSGVKSYLTTQAPAEWLNTNLKTGSIVFNVDWDAFPTLYYFTGDRFRYVTGLEPRFLYDLNPRLYWEWAHIGEGIYCEEQDCAEILEARTSALANRNQKNIWYQVQGERIANAIESDFKTDIVVMSVNRTDLLAVLDNSSRFQKELFDTENSAYAVYRILKKE